MMPIIVDDVRAVVDADVSHAPINAVERHQRLGRPGRVRAAGGCCCHRNGRIEQIVLPRHRQPQLAGIAPVVKDPASEAAGITSENPRRPGRVFIQRKRSGRELPLLSPHP